MSKSRPLYSKNRTWGVTVEFSSRKLKLTKTWVTSLAVLVLEAVDSEVLLPFVNELSIHIIGDKEIAALNKTHRGKSKPTDVLSFPNFEPKEVRGKRRVLDTFQPSLGDVVISADTTIAQSVEFKVTPQEEFVRLVVHGILHLCGYDHERVPPSEAQKMRRKEQKLRSLVSDALKIRANLLNKKRGNSPLNKRTNPSSKRILDKR